MFFEVLWLSLYFCDLPYLCNPPVDPYDGFRCENNWLVESTADRVAGKLNSLFFSFLFVVYSTSHVYIALCAGVNVTVRIWSP